MMVQNNRGGETDERVIMGEKKSIAFVTRTGRERDRERERQRERMKKSP